MKRAMPASIYLIDDDISFRNAMILLLESSGFRTKSYGTGAEILNQLPDNKTDGCILLDVEIPDISGPDLQLRLKEAGSRLPVIFLTGHGDIPTSVRTIKAGAEDFLTKPVSKAALFDAIDRALARCRAARHHDDSAVSRAVKLSSLTPREREVFAHVASGRMNKQIAYALGTTIRTVKAHRKNVMDKMAARSIAELVLTAEQLGLIS
ncbi:response regulator transcription factor [Bosea sp. 2YAB26]|uniref:response regulator transcription factor n=1 Tax=Bosea sp. 2YAB26 TaxID=3237478 RepID=UPI003F93E7A0